MRMLVFLLGWALSTGIVEASESWPEFRGPSGDGHSRATNLPRSWSESENVVWKRPIHDRGWSSPVVLGNQIWLTTATADGHQLFAVCVDRDSGKIVHDLKVFDVEQPERIAPINSYASPTPTIEPGRVYLHYGTYGTVCLDTKSGKTIWSRRDLNCDHHMGPGSSPVLFENLLVFHVDGMDVQYVIALDKTTGKTVWRTDRSIDFTNIFKYFRKGYCTPRVIDVKGRLEMISPGAKAVMAYDPHSGKELWKVRHYGWSMVPRPLFGHGLVYVVIDYDKPEIWAIRPGGTGNVTESHVAWRVRKSVPSTPSLLLIDDLIYMVSDDGIVSCIDAKTGAPVWKERLGGDYSSSPLYADGRIYLTNRNGLTTVLAPGRQFKRLATNQLDGTCQASPAIVGSAIFLRTERHLYRIEKPAFD